ncbi:dopamine N-acetyltransferase-like [Zerene cesonia]|uniref:dopamine N-acetyltransferase-like n=1 Tax=Zerene cesonia TaxID=33412 RepID=UPI0018E5762D|nr:dopamine N-acetyltransferase-like [Zerene cesonia]XP_038212461.1 dopamine N-acetyltransferase-like [Zerene cesonia]
MSNYTIGRIVEEDTEEVMKVLKRNFFIDEPLNKKLQYCTSVDDDCPDLDEYCRSTLPGISFKAIDADGKIIGVLINGISAVDFPIDYESMIKNCENPKFKKILHILLIREQNAHLATRYPNEKKLFEVKLAATDSNWRNKGIMNKLMEEAEKSARDLGIRLLRIDTSSAYSAKAAEKFGFTCLYKRAYTDIKLPGESEPIIVPDPPHVVDRVFIKELF